MMAVKFHRARAAFAFAFFAVLGHGSSMNTVRA
jgi:hypothetical protein